MKIYTRVNFKWDDDLQQYVEDSSESFEYEGPLALAGGGGGQQVTTETTEPWAAQQPYLQELFQQAQQYLQGGTPDTTGVQADLGQAVQQYQTAGGALAPYAQQLLQANQGYATGQLLDPASNPAFQEYLNLSNQAVTQQWMENVLPQLTSGAQQVGGIGGSRQGIAQAGAAGNLFDTLSRQTAGLTSQAYGQGLQATMQAQQLAPLIAQLQSAPAQAYGQAAQTGLASATLDQDLLAQLLQNYQGLITGQYGGTTTTVGPPTQTGGLAGALGAASSAAALGANPYWAAAWGLAGYF